jgi:hypothetical protein
VAFEASSCFCSAGRTGDQGIEQARQAHRNVSRSLQLPSGQRFTSPRIISALHCVCLCKCAGLWDTHTQRERESVCVCARVRVCLDRRRGKDASARRWTCESDMVLILDGSDRMEMEDDPPNALSQMMTVIFQKNLPCVCWFGMLG